MSLFNHVLTALACGLVAFCLARGLVEVLVVYRIWRQARNARQTIDALRNPPKDPIEPWEVEAAVRESLAGFPPEQIVASADKLRRALGEEEPPLAALMSARGVFGIICLNRKQRKGAQP